MTTPPPPPPEVSHIPGNRVARLVTDGLDPKNVIIGLVLLMGGVGHGLVGLEWAVVAAVFAAVVPILFIKYGVRKGRWGDQHVGKRQQRLVIIPVIMVSVAAAILLMHIGSAPSDMTAMVVAMFTTLIALLAITTVWKVSVHTAVSSGAVVMLGTALSPWWGGAYLLVPLIGWSRVALRDHTLAQTIVGAAVGTAVAGSTFIALR